MTIQQKTNEAEEALKEWGIEYTKQSDGTIVVEGNINIGNKRLTKLPDLSKVIVEGYFACNNNELTSLVGAPASVGKNFWCQDNQLTSLAGAPASVGLNFVCYGNQLISLEGAPTAIGGDFWCPYNQLTSLAGAPASVGGEIHCNDNLLTSLEGAPQEFKKLGSDLGDFSSWQEVPENLRTSPETKEKTRLEKIRKIGEASMQKQTFKPAPSIRFKAGPK